jgi:ubiquinone/menaquinone biosynthesis C-methylase UbiE
MSDEPLRTSLRAIWSAAAPSWGMHADYIDTRSGAVTDAMIAAACLGPGDRVLELGCGPGGVGLAAAEVVGPNGHVVLSDIAPEMTALAQLRAQARALGNVSVREFDLEGIDSLDASFDVVLCREALMLVPDPAKAVAEAGRVVRPGGRVVFSVWGPREHNPWLGILLDAVSKQLGVAIPPPGVPGPFSLSDGESLRHLLATRLAEVEVQQIDTPVQSDSFERWWTVVPSLAGPVGPLLASLPDEAVQAIRDDARAALDGYLRPDGYLLPGVSLVAVGRS